MRHAAVTTAASRCATSTASSFAVPTNACGALCASCTRCSSADVSEPTLFSFDAPTTSSKTLRACSFPNGCCEIFTSNKRIQSCAACFPPTRFRMSCETLEVSAAEVSGFRSVAMPRNTLPSFTACSFSANPAAFAGSGKCLASAANERVKSSSDTPPSPPAALCVAALFACLSSRYRRMSCCTACFARSMNVNALEARSSILHSACSQNSDRRSAETRAGKRSARMGSTAWWRTSGCAHPRSSADGTQSNLCDSSVGVSTSAKRVTYARYTDPSRFSASWRTFAFLSSARSPTAMSSSGSTARGVDSATSHTAVTAAMRTFSSKSMRRSSRYPAISTATVASPAAPAARNCAPHLHMSTRISGSLSPNLRRNCAR